MSNICSFTVSASRDIESIIDFIADSSGLDAADRFLNKINGKCNNLAMFPSQGHKRISEKFFCIHLTLGDPPKSPFLRGTLRLLFTLF
ncbi:MAG: type II toxin-antitoxin system RelE/ParE family toxin [Nostoc sp.]|uniref:type II toxin-antitoxin system RelE/ParE family toxin n=1 Tax=Nostoc sp. TaxID=1180 RepID=UPI002FF63624